METMVKRYLFSNDHHTSIPVINKRNDLNVNITGFSYNYVKNQYKLSIYSDLFFKDNYSVSLIDNRLMVVISEIKEYNKPSYIHNFNWNTANSQTYERIRSMDVILPGNDFYLIRHYVIPDRKMLHVILSTYR